MDADKMPEVCVLCLAVIELPPRCYPVCQACLNALRQLEPAARMERAAAVCQLVESRIQRESTERVAESARQACRWLKEAAQSFGDVLSLAKQNWRDSDGDDPLRFDDLG